VRCAGVEALSGSEARRGEVRARRREEEEEEEREEGKKWQLYEERKRVRRISVPFDHSCRSELKVLLMALSNGARDIKYPS
jgi:hypothetical protein